MKRKRFVVACANGVATSQTIVSIIENMLTEHGIHNVEVMAVDIKAIDDYLQGADAYIATIRPDHEFQVPIVDGIKFLTGVGVEEELQKLIDIAKT